MASYLWSGTVTFGLVTLPVHVKPAVDSGKVAFRMLHVSDNAPLARRYVCGEDEEVVPRRKQVRGFKVGEEYVVVTGSELEKLAAERSNSIEIEKFVDLDDIDPLYFDRPYYLVPDKGADRPYALLARALGDTGQAGIAKFVMQKREHLVALRAIDEALALFTLRFERQRLSADGIAPEKKRVSREDREALVDYIRHATRQFDPTKFTNAYEVALLKRVLKKAEEEGVEKAPDVGRRALDRNKAADRIKRTLEQLT